MNIGIDIDEVIVEFVRGYLDFYNLRHNKKIKFEDVFSYNLWEVLGVPREYAFRLADEFYKTNLFENIRLVNGAKESICNLAKKHQIFIITSRPPHIKKETESFIKKHFQDINLNVVYSGDMHAANGKTKSQICKERGISLFLEDNGKYAVECAKNGIKVFLFDKPWNQNFKHNNIIRIQTWGEVLKQIK